MLSEKCQIVARDVCIIEIMGDAPLFMISCVLCNTAVSSQKVQSTIAEYQCISHHRPLATRVGSHLSPFARTLMKHHTVRIRRIEKINHDVVQLTTERPEKYNFRPGQATNISLTKTGWTENVHPFTITSTADDDYLEFCIKTYPAHKDFTREVLSLHIGDEITLHEVFGTLVYKGVGTFVAGGAGVTPFLAILRDLHKRGTISSNKLILANKKREDIIHEDELRTMLGRNLCNILSEESREGYGHGLITRDVLTTHVSDFDDRIYLCGPPPMMKTVLPMLLQLGTDKRSIVQEES